MELNRQHTVFGLALPPRSAGRKSRARPARHGAGSPSPATTRTHPRHLPAAPPDSRSLLSQPRARRSIAVLTGACGQSPGRGGVRQHPRHRSRSHTRDRRADGALPEQRATVHPRSSAATGTRTPTPPVLVHICGDAVVLENAPAVAVITQAQGQRHALICL